MLHNFLRESWCLGAFVAFLKASHEGTTKQGFTKKAINTLENI